MNDELLERHSSTEIKENKSTDKNEYAWYVGATGNYTDFSDKFIQEGRWENGYDNKYYDQVNSIKVGDKIVIKAAYTKKRGLPFNNHGRTVGVMGIKAIGTVTKNYYDGKHLDVSWQRVQPIKEWFGDGVLRKTLHLVKASDGYIKEALLKFTFYDMPQDYSVMDIPVDDNDNDNECVNEEGTSDCDLLPVNPNKNTIHNPLNVILYGAPGTGKTYLTVEYAVAICENRKAVDKAVPVAERAEIKRRYDALVNERRIVFTTFHQSYGYEDFMQGIRPKTDGSNMQFLTVDGIFKDIADRAMKDNGNNYVIIIDEINRGNISKIFGELITLIEPDKRWGEDNQMSVTLPSGKKFAVPNNLYIIGTMNSADKSISLIDTALRRRFTFIEKAPDYDIISNTVLRDVLAKLNQYIRSELHSTDLLIGHAFFIGKEESDLVSIMNGQIIPLLYEYFYDDELRVKKALQCLEGTGVEIDTNYLGRIRVK